MLRVICLLIFLALRSEHRVRSELDKLLRLPALHSTLASMRHELPPCSTTWKQKVARLYTELHVPLDPFLNAFYSTPCS